MSKKLRLTRTQYDIGFDNGYRVSKNEWYEKGRLEGFKMYCVCSLYGMKDGLKMSDEEIARLHKTTKEYLNMVYKGYKSLNQMEKALDHDYNFQFVWKE